jgi:hypothetical protein
MPWDPAQPAHGSFGASAVIRQQWEAIERNHFQNYFVDPTFLLWPASDTSSPAHWACTGAGMNVVRETGATHLYAGPHALRLAFGSAAALATQNVFTTTSFPAYWRGKSFAYGVAIKTNAAGIAKLEVFDGVSTSATSYHSGNDAYQWLTGVHTINGSANQLVARLRVDGAGTVYFGGSCGVFGSIPPQHLYPPIFEVVDWTWPSVGNAAVNTNGVLRIAPLRPTLIDDVFLHAMTAPTGAALITDLETWDGSAWQSMFTTKPQLAAGTAGSRQAVDGTYRYRCLAGCINANIANAMARLQIEQVGSTLPGADLNVRITGRQFRRANELWLTIQEFGL